ncbi:MAG: anaerobic ribonucleoside-triphosphate reductase activating protein [Candidatus Krumholzibacteria bacterium]|nr:anaerobic ribonucleoside-triphosphate reductase activating protein [Candidatus Krumholzibacteria bacterium]
MTIGGFQRFTLSDFPGRVAAIVFTQGCNFRCPYCHNASLIPATPPPGRAVPERYVLDCLRARAGRIDGVVVTGGEPTVQDDLPLFLRAIREIGLAVKLDTNGGRPDVIRRLVGEGLVDFIAMDVKGPLERYRRCAGVPVPPEAIAESMEIVSGGGVEHEFRTTVMEGLLSGSDLEAVARLIPPGSPHRLQPCRPPSRSRSEGDPVWTGARSSASGASSTSITTPPAS